MRDVLYFLFSFFCWVSFVFDVDNEIYLFIYYYYYFIHSFLYLNKSILLSQAGNNLTKFSIFIIFIINIFINYKKKQEFIIII